jgi:hypothetical protein
MNVAIPDQYRHVGSLLNALEAVRNFRALLLMALTLIAAVGAFMLFKSMHAGWAMLAGLLLALAILFYGMSAVGTMLMHKAQTGEAISIVEAIVRSLAISHRLIAVGLLALLVFLGLMLVVALLFVVCKLPGLGPLLYFFALPFSILLLGLTYAAFLFVVVPMAGPAVWRGEKVFDILSQLFAIIRQRLSMTVVLLVFLGILVFVTAIILAVIFWSGLLFSGGLSLSVLKSSLSGGLAGMFGPMLGGFGGMGGGYDQYGGMGGMSGGGDGSGLVMAGLAGAGILFAAMLAPPALVLLQGYCQIYLIVTDGLDVSAEKAVLRERMEQAKRAAEEAKRRAEEAKRKMDEQRARAATAPTTQPLAAAATECPACGGSITPDDVFCGSCGHKLK